MPKLPPKPERTHKLESTIQTEARQVFAEEAAGLLFRNNVGKLRDEHGRVVSYGLAIGSADLIGIQCVVLRCPCCGASLPPLGRFVGYEVKQPGKYPTEDQQTWLRTAEAHGAVVGVVRSAEDARALVERGKRW